MIGGEIYLLIFLIFKMDKGISEFLFQLSDGELNDLVTNEKVELLVNKS